MIRNQAINLSLAQGGLFIIDVPAGQGSNVFDETVRIKVRKGRRVDPATFRIHLARHDAFATELLESVMKTADSGE